MLSRLAATLVLFGAIEGCVFHSGLYSSILEPQSTAGTVYWALRNERERPIAEPLQVLALGDSRMRFRARLANEVDAKSGVQFANIAVPGTTERCWYYMLREADPDARRYAAVIVPVDNYDDEDWEDMAERILDASYLAPILRVTDAVDFSRSYRGWNHRWEAFRTCVLKGFAFKRDFQDFLLNHRKRLAAVKVERAESARRAYEWIWDQRDLSGLSVDWNARKIVFPECMTANERRVLQERIFPSKAEQTGARAAYRRQWIGRILARYKGTRTRVVIVRLPRGPAVLPATGTNSSSVRDFGQRGEAALLDEHLFDDLERPEFFADAVHMNARGSDRFSATLAAEVRKVLER